MSGAIPDSLYPRFSDGEFERRHARARTLMSSEELSALVVYGHSGMPVLFAQSQNHVSNAREMASIETSWGGADSAATIALVV